MVLQTGRDEEREEGRKERKGDWTNPRAQFGSWELVKNYWILCSSERGLIKKKPQNPTPTQTQTNQFLIFNNYLFEENIVATCLYWSWKLRSFGGRLTPPLKLNFFLVQRESSCLWSLNKDRSEFFPYSPFFPKHGSSEKDKGVISICTPLLPFMLFSWSGMCSFKRSRLAACLGTPLFSICGWNKPPEICLVSLKFQSGGQ